MWYKPLPCVGVRFPMSSSCRCMAWLLAAKKLICSIHSENMIMSLTRPGLPPAVVRQHKPGRRAGRRTVGRPRLPG